MEIFNGIKRRTPLSLNGTNPFFSPHFFLLQLNLQVSTSSIPQQLTAWIFKKCLTFVAWSCRNKRELGALSLQKNDVICRRRQNLFKIQTFLSDVKKETMIFQMMGISIQDIGSEFILQNTVLIGITTNCGQTSLRLTRMCKIHVHRFRSHSFYINFFRTFKEHSKCK